MIVDQADGININELVVELTCFKLFDFSGQYIRTYVSAPKLISFPYNASSLFGGHPVSTLIIRPT